MFSVSLFATVFFRLFCLYRSKDSAISTRGYEQLDSRNELCFFAPGRGFKRANAWPLPQKRRIMTKNIGMLLLAIYLILVGITTLFHVAIGAIVMGVLALVTGILILVGK